MSRPSRHAPDTLERPAEWSESAACAAEGADPAVFFPKDFRREAPLIAAQAKEFCQRCPVVAECLAHALAVPEWTGVWGGLDEDERRSLRRSMQRRRLRRAKKRKTNPDAT
ncbi:hypothetical protein DIZ27_14535 [Streptomyces sp. NWU339]|uniref:WhiB family transcriptional regulator n=1 Tax=Streptomyces sp. NWU339 TaxID=2185284 RepID=UPI000D683BA1|nr:WhiB family transcriptional regulator [Streptomyces sp. NWU339]PWI09750.1 hypothetical protein DIZ27_14535 [Streptomyces sp. NWU339]